MESGMTLTDILLNEAKTTYKITEELFHLVSDNELSWTPPTGKNWMTVGQLMMHCASFGCGKAIQGFVKGDWGGTKIEDLSKENHVPPPSELPCVESVEQAFKLLSVDKKLALKCIAEVDETKLLDKTFVAPWGGPELPLFQHLLHMIAHLNQHKGQLFYYLKLMGKNVNTNDLWGE
jgi:hypothetical protein